MNKSTVNVPIPGSEYDVHIWRGALADVGRELRKINRSRRAALVCSEEVAERYGMALSTTLARSEYDVAEFVIPDGEDGKTWEVAGMLVEQFAQAGLGRRDIVVGLGGGAVSDVAGFAAATYMRGIRYVNIPTTLLAMVDSSIGGKTGVNLPQGKNLAGAFVQPLAVFVDPAALDTLPENQWLSGLAEVVKSMLLDSEHSWWWIANNIELLREKNPAIVHKAIVRSLNFKSRVVASDVRESGNREILNYGHTMGHAIEKLAGFGTFTHGEAVAEGMRFAARLAVEVIGAPVGLVADQDAILDGLGLTTLEWSAPPAAVLEAMKSDKKARDGSVRFVLPSAPGITETGPVPDEIILAHLEAWARSKELLAGSRVDTGTESTDAPAENEA